MEKILAYTAITGGREKGRDDILAFTDYSKFKIPVMNAKVFKILSHRFVDNPISIWVDGNVYLEEPKEKIVKDILGNADMALCIHPERDCIYEEAEAAKTLYEDKNVHASIDEQIEYYRSKGFPEHAGMPECNVIIRRNNKKVRDFCNDWWSEICRWSFRDQLSFPVALSRHNLKINYIPKEENVRSRLNSYFRYEPHTSNHNVATNTGTNVY